jgi:hypothetical protein
MLPGPYLVTSYTEYERLYGGLEIGGRPCQLALAARGFFSNGGRRLYIQRVFSFSETTGANPQIDVPANFAALGLPSGRANPLLQWRARGPGSGGARIQIVGRFRRSKNVLIQGRLTGVTAGAAVETAALSGGVPPDLKDDTAPDRRNIRLVARRDDGTLGYAGTGGVTPVGTSEAAFHITLDVEVHLGDRVDVYSGTELGPSHPRSIFTVLSAEDPADEGCLVWIAPPQPAGNNASAAGDMLEALLSTTVSGAFLSGGGDGLPLTAVDLQGQEANPDNLLDPARGLGALADVEDIALVAMPDTVTLSQIEQPLAVDALIEHCRRARYRMAIVDPPDNSSISEVRAFRSRFDSSYAAIYYPWLRIIDPTRKPDPGMPPPMLDVPPSGYVAGVYARTDLERGVHKAPANEVLIGISEFVTNVTFDRQSVLNPEGINALRFLEGRANRIWGARTMSSDPEWRYVNVRRLFNYLEASIDRSTQWSVFEPNNERLWGSIRQSIEDFLLTVWRTGALMGTRPEDAFFVSCDRTTMTQNDLDNGRLICLIGVAPTYPAEFVIFRIGQWTADARRS